MTHGISISPARIFVFLPVAELLLKPSICPGAYAHANQYFDHLELEASRPAFAGDAVEPGLNQPGSHSPAKKKPHNVGRACKFS